MEDEVKKEEIQQEENKIVETEQPKPAKSFFSRLIREHKEKKEKKRKQLESEKLSDEENKKIEEKLVVANQEVKEKSERKKKIKNICFFILNIVLVAAILLWNILSSEDFIPLDLSKVNFLYVAIVIVLLAFAYFFDVSSIHRMIYRKSMRSRWALAYKSTSILRYYDAVTPMSTGGQPFMVTYLTSRDIPGSTSLSIPIAKLLFQKSIWLLTTTFCLIYTLVVGSVSVMSLVASVIGYLICFFLVGTIMLLSFSKKVGNKLVVWVLKLLVKMRIVKNYDKQYAKVMNFVEDYQQIMKEYGKAKWDVVYQFVLHLFRIICIYSIPYFIYQCFPSVEGATQGSYIAFFVYAGMVDLASSFIPLPGGTGMNEISFTALFTPYLKGYTFWALLLWRFCTYYFYLLQGIGVLGYDTVYGNRKYRWIQAKRKLQAESQEFKRIQIEQFRRERNRRRKKQKV